MNYFQSVKKNMKILYKSDKESDKCSPFSDKINCTSFKLTNYSDTISEYFTKHNLINTDIIYIADSDFGELPINNPENGLALITNLISNMGQYTVLVFCSNKPLNILNSIISSSPDNIYYRCIYTQERYWWLFSKTEYVNWFIRDKQIKLFNYNSLTIDLPNDTDFMNEFIDVLYGRYNRKWLYFAGLLFIIICGLILYFYGKHIYQFMKRLFRRKSEKDV